MLTEHVGDLFDAPEGFALAHCVSRDLRMSRGIAVIFRDRFGRVDDLRAQNPGVGESAVLRFPGTRFPDVFYLVTKERYFDKPTLRTLEASLLHMRESLMTPLAIPHLGCGLDRLAWDDVRPMIERVFRDREVRVYTI